MLKEKTKRPAQRKLGLSAQILISVSPETKMKLEKDALARGMNVSVLLRMLIDKHLQK